MDWFRQRLSRWRARCEVTCLPGWQQRRGSVAVMVGLVLPVVIAMVALGTEVTLMFFKQRQLQVIADAAAFSAATALARGPVSPSLEAQAVATQLIALTVSFTGNSLLQRNCTGIPVQPIGGVLVSLVE